ncbi:hypothetical protein EWM64_g5991 [Hericium alpestre]|uniref:DDE-1 domain-containing protein n=1 Tax=Hericium alpestre TaxID=135208 RepID=A0A4Y9ZVD9_9AGAM|nr:hypothetical protein EWM64_g5991 [Hericium alpestre]
MDKIGIQLGGGHKGTGEQFFFAIKDKSKYQIKSDDLELVTILESVCADGTAPIKPCFVFSSVKMCESWFEEQDDDILVVTTENGWTNDNLFVEWFMCNFIPQAKAHTDLASPILLMYDGHGSHLTWKMIDAAMGHNIILFCLKPHTTCRLQPCDVGAFGPLKNSWNAQCSYVLRTTGSSLKAKDIVHEYTIARKEAFKKTTIEQAFRKAGIAIDESRLYLHCTPEIFTAADFALSISTSTQLHLPEGYPVPDWAQYPDQDMQEGPVLDLPHEMSSDEGSDDEDIDTMPTAL